MPSACCNIVFSLQSLHETLLITLKHALTTHELLIDESPMPMPLLDD